MSNFKDKAVIISGGSRGIGLEIAKALGKDGAKIAILAKSYCKDKQNELITQVIANDKPSNDKYFTYHLALGIKSKIIASTTVITISNSGKNKIKLLIKSCGIYKANPIIVDIVLDIISING